MSRAVMESNARWSPLNKRRHTSLMLKVEHHTNLLTLSLLPNNSRYLFDFTPESAYANRSHRTWKRARMTNCTILHYFIYGTCSELKKSHCRHEAGQSLCLARHIEGPIIKPQSQVDCECHCVKRLTVQAARFIRHAVKSTRGEKNTFSSC